MPEPAMIDLLKTLQYLRKRSSDYKNAQRSIESETMREFMEGKSEGFKEAAEMVASVLKGHQRTTEKFAMNLQQVLDDE